MNCPKCQGLMIEERFSNEAGMSFPGWRCLCCGNIIDRTIIVHRQLQREMSGVEQTT